MLSTIRALVPRVYKYISYMHYSQELETAITRLATITTTIDTTGTSPELSEELLHWLMEQKQKMQCFVDSAGGRKTFFRPFGQIK